MSDKSHDPNQMTGAAMIVRALIDHGVKHIFGYPGGAILPVYDALGDRNCTTFWSATNKAPRTWRMATRAPADKSALLSPPQGQAPPTW